MLHNGFSANCFGNGHTVLRHADGGFFEPHRICRLFFDDYTDKMELYFSKWKKLGLTFDGIYTGFLGSEKQMGIVERFFRSFAQNRPKLLWTPLWVTTESCILPIPGKCAGT